MPLNGYISLCGDRQRIITSKDKGTSREHRALNINACKVSQYKIDADVVCDASIRCDFLVMNDEKKDAYLIELKGSDIEHALDQLEATAERFRTELKGYAVKYRIVCSRAKTQAIHGNKYKKFCKKHAKPGEFICKENKIEDII